MGAPGTGRGSLEELIRRLQQGDETALEPLIERTQATALRLAWSLLRYPHRCEDVLQEVYLTVYRTIRQLRDPQAFTTWFCRMVANRCKRVLRERRPLRLHEVAGSRAEPATTGMAERSLDRLQLGRALARLREADRQVLTLREVLQLSCHEIAGRLALPIGTVGSRLSNARRSVAEAFGPREGDVS